MTSQRQHTANLFCLGLTAFEVLPPGLFENALLLAHFATLPHATDQTIPEVPDEVDKETVDDYTFSDVTPAGMSAKVDNLNEVLLGLEQSKPMVKKGMYRVIMHGSSLKWQLSVLACYM